MPVALATSKQFPTLIRDDHFLMDALAEEKLPSVPVVWSDPAVDWSRYDAVVIRSTWDYVERLPEFRAWLQHLKAQNVRVFNPVSVLEQNIDKVYLKHLANAGVDILPTLWCDQTNLQAIGAELQARGWHDIVVKPAIAAGAFRTIKTHVSRWNDDQMFVQQILNESEVLIQPYDREIETSGEWSFLFFGDTFSHAVLKKPKAGDFRVQFIHGGDHRLTEAPAKLLDAARRIHELSSEPLLYSRIDGIWRDERFILMEWEKLEPFLFLEEYPPAAQLFAKTLKHRLG